MITRLWMILTVSLLCQGSAFAGPHLGGTIADFQAAWGRPTREERVDRTARLIWGPYEKKTKLPAGIREADLQFLDQVACQVVLRGGVGVEEKWGWIARQIRKTIPSCPQKLAEPQPNFEGDREFYLKDGTFIIVRKFKERTIIIIHGVIFLKNQEVFAHEIAKIHPPEANF